MAIGRRTLPIIAYICDPKHSLLTSIAGVGSWVTYRPRAILVRQEINVNLIQGCFQRSITNPIVVQII